VAALPQINSVDAAAGVVPGIWAVLGEMLEERPSLCQCHDLHAVADTQGGQARYEGRAREAQIEFLLDRVHGGRFRVGRAEAQGFGAEIVAAGQQESIEPLNGVVHGVGILGDPIHGGEGDRQTPGRCNRVKVARAQGEAQTLRLLKESGHGDARSGISGHARILDTRWRERRLGSAAMEFLGWPLTALYLAGGGAFLFKGADWLVGGSVRIAARFGVSALVVGMTVVAFGTSAPEIVVSALAALEGKGDLSIGNVLGSNIANVGLVLGACTVIHGAILQGKSLHRREIFWLFCSVGLLWVLCWDHALTRLDGAILLAVFAAYNVHILTSSPREQEISEGNEDSHPIWHIIGGIVLIGLGAEGVVHGAESGAVGFGIPASVVGLTVVAIGTSLPELATGIGGALRGEKELSLGNVVGSNVFNMIAVMGIVVLIQPLVPGAEDLSPERSQALEATFKSAVNIDFPVVLGFSAAAVLLARIGGDGRLKGGLLLSAYAAYTVWLFLSRV